MVLLRETQAAPAAGGQSGGGAPTKAR